jgi:hypothetical protein
MIDEITDKLRNHLSISPDGLRKTMKKLTILGAPAKI